MKLSTKGRYGLRAMIDLADFSEKSPVSISEISKRQDISISYLEQLIAKLKKANLVSSIRGCEGGYFLAKPANEISVGDILRALEGDLAPVDCLEIKKNGGCSDAGVCVTKYVWKKIDESITNTVNTIMLDELVENNRKTRNIEKQFDKKCEL